MENEKKIFSVPNQKIIKIKHDLCDKGHIYATCNVNSNRKALKELSPNTYKVYMYFALNQNNYTFALSCQAVQNATGMSDKTYQKAVHELIDKGYLEAAVDKGNMYTFYEGTKDSPDYKADGQESGNINPSVGKDIPDEKGKNWGSSTEKNTGEILYILHNNTNNTYSYSNKEKRHMRHSRLELIPSELDAIRERIESGQGYIDLAKEFNLSENLAYELEYEYAEKNTFF